MKNFQAHREQGLFRKGTLCSKALKTWSKLWDRPGFPQSSQGFLMCLEPAVAADHLRTAVPLDDLLKRRTIGTAGGNSPFQSLFPN